MDVACQVNTIEEPCLAPLVLVSKLENEQELLLLTGLLCKQLFDNIVPLYTELRKSVSERGFSIMDQDAVLLTFVKLY